ncbi:MAG TPA: helix-turn-helix transcriptional regulator [Candidatus Acidoferrales bacterium]|nr:helix-turn-helix transcriptional regulator [Candidatus Acidoferrales bacterium]
MNVITKNSCVEIGRERTEDVAHEEHSAVIIVVDRALNVVLEPSHPALAYEAFENAPVVGGRLTPEFERAVREAARDWILGDTPHGKSTFSIPPSHVVRAQALAGSDGTFLALTIEHRRERQALARARQRFDLTPREQQVLRFILEGAQANEIAAALHIAESTVQGYFKRLLAKTRSRNRAAMVALVLDWHVRWERTSSGRAVDASA